MERNMDKNVEKKVIDRASTGECFQCSLTETVYVYVTHCILKL